MIVETLIVLGVFAVLVALGMPVFGAMGAAGATGVVVIRGVDRLGDISFFLYDGLANYLLVAVPLFVLTGTLMHEIGASRDLFAFAADLVGRVPHALGIAVLATCAVFAAISGSSVATAATVGLVALPAMRRQGYQDSQGGAIVAAGGTLGILIPPSIAMIIFGVLTEQSIGQLFIAGILPGLLAVVVFTAALFVFVRPAIAGEQVSLKAKLRSLVASLPVLVIPGVVVAAIYTGATTATEAAALAVALTVALGALVYRNLSWSRMRNALAAALGSSAMILALITFGELFTHALTLARVPTMVSQALADSSLPTIATFSLMIVVYVVLGMVLESTSMLIVTVPIFFPVAQAIGLEPLAFGAIAVLAMEMGQITPPVGINLFVVSGVGDIGFGTLAKRVVPYFLALLALIYLVYFFPGVATWLPSRM